MNKLFSVLLCVCAMVFGASAQSQMAYLVEITDMAGDKGFEIVDKAGLDDLKKQVAEENAAFSQMVAEARAKWKQAKNVKGSFPASVAKARKFKIVGQGAEDKLAAKKDRKEASLAKKAASDSEKLQKKMELIRDEDKRAAEQEKNEKKLRQRATAIAFAASLLKVKLGREIPFYGTEITTYAEPVEFPAAK